MHCKVSPGQPFGQLEEFSFFFNCQLTESVVTHFKQFVLVFIHLTFSTFCR